MTPTVKSIDPPRYTVIETVDHDDLVSRALASLNVRLKTGPTLSSSADVRALLRLEFSKYDHHREHFIVLYLDSQYALIESRMEFVGTLTQTSVYPREIARAALTLNASAVILAHNHPSGNAEPSRADATLTTTLKSALALVDVTVLDHFVLGDSVTSMAERGLV